MSPDSPSGQQIRAVLLEVVNEQAARKSVSLQMGTVLREVSTRLGIRDLAAEQALLTAWGDLFRQGHLAWGYNLINAEPPFCHVTETGRSTLKTYSKDPANMDGYMAHLLEMASPNPIVESYIREALSTYNSNCVKAAAVMVGAASESVILELRDTIVARLSSLSRAPSADLNDWRIKRIIDGIQAELSQYRRQLPRKLSEAFDSYWPAFVQQIRTARNDAGHPSDIEPVTPETVHGSLLIFHEVAKLGRQLVDWIQANMP